MPPNPTNPEDRDPKDPTPEEAALDFIVSADAPEYDQPVRPPWVPDHVSQEDVERTIYIPRNRRDPSRPYRGPELDLGE